MTAQQPQREHCGFEDYCRHYCPASQGRDPCKGTVKQIFCEHDTRSRLHSPAPDDFEIPEAWRGDPIGVAYYRGKAAGRN